MSKILKCPSKFLVSCLPLTKNVLENHFNFLLALTFFENGFPFKLTNSRRTMFLFCHYSKIPIIVDTLHQNKIHF